MKRLADRNNLLCECAGTILHDQWAEFNRLREMVLTGQEPDTVHDLRVASRRLRATLRLLEPFISRKRVTFIAVRIRRLTRGLGRLRNIDEGVLFFSTAATELDGVVGPLGDERKRERARIVTMLKRFPHHSVDRVVRHCIAELVGAAATSRRAPVLSVYLSGVVFTGFLEINHLLPTAVLPVNREPRHALRIAIKKWRYNLETISRMVDKDYGVVLELLKEYQSLLGRMNDLVEFGELCTILDLDTDCRVRIDDCLNHAGEKFLRCFCALAEARPLHCTLLL